MLKGRPAFRDYQNREIQRMDGNIVVPTIGGR